MKQLIVKIINHDMLLWEKLLSMSIAHREARIAPNESARSDIFESAPFDLVASNTFVPGLFAEYIAS